MPPDKSVSLMGSPSVRCWDGLGRQENANCSVPISHSPKWARGGCILPSTTTDIGKTISAHIESNCGLTDAYDVRRAGRVADDTQYRERKSEWNNRVLGRSGLKVPALSLGTATFGGAGEFFKGFGETDVAEATRLVDICLEAGLTMFDTADAYSGGVSEEILGQAIKGRRDKVLISTKGTFRTGSGANDVGSSRFHLIETVNASLRRLGTDYIDLYQLHGFDAVTPVEESLSTLETLVQAGKIRYIGCSNFSGWHLMKSLAASERYGWARYVANQTYYSLIGREYEWELMPLGLDQGVGAVVWSPLGWGRLTGKIRRGAPLPESSRMQTKRVADAAPPSPRRLFSGCRRIGRRSAGDGQNRSANCSELAVTASHRIHTDHRRTQRGTIAPKSRGGRLEPDAGADRQIGRGKSRDSHLPVLASGRLCGKKSSANAALI